MRSGSTPAARHHPRPSYVSSQASLLSRMAQSTTARAKDSETRMGSGRRSSTLRHPLAVSGVLGQTEADRRAQVQPLPTRRTRCEPYWHQPHVRRGSRFHDFECLTLAHLITSILSYPFVAMAPFSLHRSHLKRLASPAHGRQSCAVMVPGQ